MIQDYFSLSFKNLKHRGIRSWLTLLGIFIGIMAVVSLITLGNGLKMAVNSQFGISSTQVLTVQAGGLNYAGPPGSGVSTPLTMDDLRAIEKVNNVERVIRRNIVTSKLEFNEKVTFSIAVNIPEGEDRKFVYDQLEIEAKEGRLLKDGDTNKVFLGYNFYADKVGLDKPLKRGDKILIQDENFEVVGIAKKKGSFLLDNAIYMNEEPLKELFEFGDEVDIIVVLVKDKDLMDKTKEDIEKVLRQQRDVKLGEEDFEVSTPDAMLSTVNSILAGIQAFIIIIASLSIIVGAIGIVNTMTTSVLERKKEIGIMKAIGAKNEQIFLQFFIESGFMGLIGGAMGALFGIVIGYFGTMGINNWIGTESQPEISFILIAVSLTGSFLIGSIAGITPAMQAARQNPVEALKS